jgi:hypothetical protein
MFKTRYPIPGESPGLLRPREEAANRRSVITLIEYDRAHLEERTIADREELPPHLDNQRVTWINIDGLLSMLAVALFQIVYFKKRRWL